MRSVPLVVVGLLGLLLAPESGAAPAKKAGKSAPACGARILPLVTGNSWTYVQAIAPQPILPELQKVAPRQARSIVITVKSIAPKGTDTVVSLEEKVTYELTQGDGKKPATTADVVVNSTITCSKTKFEISPDSFFFSGEPGGYRALVFDKIERSKDTSWKLTNGTIGDEPWREDVVAHFTRQAPKTSTAKLSPGKLELERAFTPEAPEAVSTKTGLNYQRAEKLALVTTGRVTLDAPVSPNPAPSELPANWVTKFWFEPEVGMVQALNMYAHMYHLAEMQLN